MRRHSRFDFSKFFLKVSLYGVSSLLLIAGLALCFVKSPSSKAHEFAQMAAFYEDQMTNLDVSNSAYYVLQAQRNALYQKALSYAPYNENYQEAYNQGVNNLKNRDAASLKAPVSFLDYDGLTLTR